MAKAYRDKYGVLHVVNSLEMAQRFAHSEIVDYTGEHEFGYPVVGGETVFDYGNREVYFGGNRNDGIPLAELDKATAAMVQAVLAQVGI
ncbi:hypothetical protein SAMN05660649_04248 [Desulfotomaculum arcticum]|uniref:Uncharacterized protein n=1 Tax=Desulfotruncus arcticus DSM 17038 TaxID=1121424 RepID=A0A1I2Y7F9_9FIRM|nr:hypothetical protein [Desulfotruncus arcticus]SFH20896.1 hypothetical protein SAMN05660649_04248 [Desulfotomaculum arcticum] [Desulfotruncus arcticus DSM 17038]